jgi:hypothetical protein
VLQARNNQPGPLNPVSQIVARMCNILAIFVTIRLDWCSNIKLSSKGHKR